MAISGAVAAVVGAVAAVGGTTASIIAGNQARANARHAADLQQQAQGQEIAQNAQQQADARRQQVREERVKQARIVQSANNSGAEDSSGAIGSLASLGTQGNTAGGNFAGTQMRSQAINGFNQGAADSIFASQQDSQDASIDNTIAGAGKSLFSTSMSQTGTNSPYNGFSKAYNSIFS